MERLRGYLLRLGNPHLRALAECFLMDETFVRNFATCPAGVKLHHAYVGGLLEHVVTMMDVADKLLPLYPAVDRDLVLMGVFLHDAGKTRELTYTRAFGYSDEGQLVGHIPMAVEMLTEAAAKVPDLTGEPVPRELMLRLRHMILSHHGELNYGSPKVPMTPEAMLLHLIDLIDTRMHMVMRELPRGPQQPAARGRRTTPTSAAASTRAAHWAICIRRAGEDTTEKANGHASAGRVLSGQTRPADAWPFAKSPRTVLSAGL